MGRMTLELARPDAVRAPEPPSERDAFLSALRAAGGTIGRRKGWIAGSVALCVAAALALILVRAPVYVSTAQVLLDPRGLNVTENEVVPRPPSSDVNDAIIETQVRLLTSDGVLARVASKLDLAHDPDYVRAPGPLGRLKAALSGAGAEPTPDARADGTIAQLRREIGVQREGKSFVVTITARAAAPEKAARIATAIATVFIDELERRRRDIVVQARDAMAATLAGQRDRLAKSEEAVERYKTSIAVVDADGRLLNTTRLAELNSQLLTARTSTRTLAARLQQLEALRRPGTGTAPDSAEAVDSILLTQLRTSRAEFGRQQETLRATLGPRHPQVVEMEAQVKSLNRAVSQEIARLIATAQGDLKAANAREQALTRDIAKAEGGMAKTNAALVDLRQLDREAVAQRSVYEKFLGRERELREQESVGGTNATLVADAKPVPESVGLRPALLIAAAVAAGLVLGTGGVLAFERFDGRVHAAESLTARTGIGVIGVLPMAVPRADDRSGVASLLTPSRGTQTSRALYRVTDALDAVTRERPTKLLVLSTAEGPVRPILSTNIVLAQAKRGRKTLLVDADDRSGRLSWLVRRSGPDAMVVSCAVEGFPPFSATLARRDKASLSPREDVLEGLNDYECIVIDASSTMDEVALRRLADAATAIIVVVQSGLTTFAHVEDLKAALSRNAGKLLGALVVVPGTDVAVPTATTVAAPPKRGRIGTFPSFRGEFS